MESNFVEAMGMATGIIISLGFFSMFVLIVYYPTRARNKERMALIEKGVDVKDLYKKRTNGKDSFFKVGVVVVGIAIGLLFGMILSNFQINPVVAYFAMILLFGGVAVLVANYFVEKKKQ